VERLAAAHPELHLALVQGCPDDVPAMLEPLAQSVLNEAVRNARKHAQPTSVTVRIGRSSGAFWMEVVNDGVHAARRHAGMGLRLASLEALQSNGFVEFGEREPGTWQVRLVVPYDDD
jgi:signal transduction histidine kinase